MNLHLMAYVVWLGLAAASGNPSIDDRIKTFEEAVAAAPPVQSGSGSILPMGRVATVDDLKTAVQGGENSMAIEGLINVLMATHPSEGVQKAGQNLIEDLESERKAREAAFEARANTVFAKVESSVKKAKAASELDKALKDLQSLQSSPEAANSAALQALVGKINAIFQYVTLWQDYLQAVKMKNSDGAQNTLRTILENRQIDAPSFFPRSELLAMQEKAKEGWQTPSFEGSSLNPDDLFDSIKKVDDVEDVVVQLIKNPPSSLSGPLDYSWLLTLDQQRQHAAAGFPAELNVKDVLYGSVMSDRISRVVAMELLGILPYYFGTDVSDPPESKETVAGYLDRLGTEANSQGNFALLQRVIAAKTAIANSQGSSVPSATQQFLAGLSQEAAGQYAPAVMSYENALKEMDSFLPIKLVGVRLAAIKSEYPEDFNKGMSAFLTPPPVNANSGFGFSPWNRSGSSITVLPIPITFSIPPRPVAPSTNAAPIHPISPSTNK